MFRMCIKYNRRGGKTKLCVYENVIFAAPPSLCTSHLNFEQEYLQRMLLQNTLTWNRRVEVRTKPAPSRCIYVTFAEALVPSLFLSTCRLKMIRRHFVSQGQRYRNINASCCHRPAPWINAANCAYAHSIRNHVRSLSWFRWIHSLLLWSVSHPCYYCCKIFCL